MPAFINPFPVLSIPGNASLIRARPLLAQRDLPLDLAAVLALMGTYPPVEITGAVCGPVGNLHLATLTGEVRVGTTPDYPAPLAVWGLAFSLADNVFAVEMWPYPYTLQSDSHTLVVPITLWALEGQLP